MYRTTKTWTLTTLGGDGVKTVYVQFRDGAGNGSGSFFDSLGDKAINDDFTLAVALKF